MGVTVPSSVNATNLDQTSDTPANARADLYTLTTSFNTLLGQINSIGITQPGDGLEIVAQSAGTKDKLAVKLNGTSLNLSASGLKIADAGITLAMLGQNGAATNDTLKWNGSAWIVSAPAASGNQKLKKAIFTSTGAFTWTVPTGVTEAKVTVVGGGGAGGNANSGGNVAGGGGGGGATAIRWATGLTPGATTYGSVGAAGSESWWNDANSNTSPTTNLCRAGAGSGGGSNGVSAAGGAGGSALNGNVLIPGGVGGDGAVLWQLDEGRGIGFGGAGGSSAMGNGAMAPAKVSTGGASGNAGSNYGGGGSGAIYFSTSGTGGAGGQGIVIIEWVEA